MFNFSKKSKIKEGVVAVFDIRSASVGGSLILLRENKIPKILYTTRKQIPFKEKLNIKLFTSSMIRTLNYVVDDIEKRGVVHLNFRTLSNKEIKEAFCFFSSPWYISQIQVVKIKKQKPFYLTDEIIHSLVQKEQEDFKQEESNFFGKDSKVEIIDNKIVQFRLNGYKTENPFGKKVKKIEASVFMSLISSDVADKVEKTILKIFHLDKIHMYSFALASFFNLRDIFELEDDFIMLDVSGEVTDVSYIRNDKLKEIQTFPIGKNTFVRNIIKTFKTNYSSAVSLLNTYVQGKLDVNTTQHLEVSLSDVKKDWVRFLEDRMLSLSDGAILPRTIFVVADENVGDILIKAIKECHFTKLVFPDYNKFVNSVLIGEEHLKDFCEFGKETKKSVSIGIEAVFIRKFL